MLPKIYGENPPAPPPLIPRGELARQCEKLVQLLSIRKVGLRSSRADGGHDVHDPMVCRCGWWPAQEGQSLVDMAPCRSCINWAFRTLEQIAEIVGVELPVREELT